MKTKCNLCSHLSDYHHDYCPIDSKELTVWEMGYTDSISKFPKKTFHEAAHNKIYELGYWRGKHNTVPSKELVMAELIRVLNIV